MSQLELINVSYRYPKAHVDAVKNIHCHFDASCVSAVVGASGSGKTTLLALMAGLDIPTTGDILVAGDPLATMDLDLYRREKVAMIFQAFQLFPLLTAIENVCVPMELNGVPPKEAEEAAIALLNELGITGDMQKRYPSKLSGGEQQRVAIARALGSGARVLLADEPTGNLDGENAKILMDILLDLAHKQGYCIVIVTHDPDVAAQTDKIWKMSHGELHLSS